MRKSYLSALIEMILLERKTAPEENYDENYFPHIEYDTPSRSMHTRTTTQEYSTHSFRKKRII